MPTERIRDKSFAVPVDGLEATIKMYKRAGTDVPERIKEANKRFAEVVAEKARSRVYPTVHAVSPTPSPDNRPNRRPGRGSLGRTKASIRANASQKSATIVAGGPKAEGFFGHEFGGQGRPTTRMFPIHRGRDGYFLYPTIRGEYKDLAAAWEAIIDEVFQEGKTE